MDAARTTFTIGPLFVNLTAPQETLEKLKTDFSLFAGLAYPEKLASQTLNLVIQIAPSHASGSGNGKRGFRLFRFRDASCYGIGPKRTVLYNDGAFVETLPEKTTIGAPSEARLHEIAYLYLLSKSGELFDFAGLHRIHALAVTFEKTKQTSLFLMDSGVGKSTLALSLSRLMTSTRVAYFSDEIPVTDGHILYPFPIRAALSSETLKLFPKLEFEARSALRKFKRQLFSEKHLLALSQLGPIAKPSRADAIFICTRNPDSVTPEITKASRFTAFFQIFRSGVVGIGVPQMTEHLLRFNSSHLLRMTRMAFSRLAASFRLTLSCSCYRFVLTNSPERNVQALEKELRLA